MCGYVTSVIAGIGRTTQSLGAVILRWLQMARISSATPQEIMNGELPLVSVRYTPGITWKKLVEHFMPPPVVHKDFKPFSRASPIENDSCLKTRIEKCFPAEVLVRM